MEALQMNFSFEKIESKFNGEKWTPELGRFLENKGICFEIIDGLICIKSKPYEHDSAKNIVSLDLNINLRKRSLPCKASVEMRISRNNEGDILIPDVTIIEKHKGELAPNRVYSGIPKLVIEVMSSNRNDDLSKKRLLYAEMRIPEYWIIDLDGKSITQYVLNGDTYGGKHITYTEGVISHHICGLTINVEELFKEILEDLEDYTGPVDENFKNTSLFK